MGEQLVHALTKKALFMQPVSDEALQLDSIERCDAYMTAQPQSSHLGRAILKAVRKKTAPFTAIPKRMTYSSDGSSITADTSDDDVPQDTAQPPPRVRRRDVLMQRFNFAAVRGLRPTLGGA